MADDLHRRLLNACQVGVNLDVCKSAAQNFLADLSGSSQILPIQRCSHRGQISHIRPNLALPSP